MERDLSGTWRAKATDSAAEPTATGDGYDDSSWTPVEVPGHWQENPEFAHHEGPVMYRTRFHGGTADASRRSRLTFGGIFYQADVWLDDAYLGDTEGYFAPHSFDVTDLLRDGTDHTLAVEVTCRRSSNPRRKTTLLGSYEDPPSIPDFANPGGIWRPVTITETGPVAIRRFSAICVAATGREARVRLRVVLDSDGERTVAIRRWVAGEVDEDAVALSDGENQLEWTVAVADPPLWWPAALGDQPLVGAGIEVGDDEGTLSDRREVRTGLRSIGLNGWVASINGERVFLKGANQRPLDEWPARLTPERLDPVVIAARDIGLDLIRVQGHVAPPALYEAADRLGVLVWADLPLFGGMSRGVRREAARQARDAVDLLGHHPSVLLWGAHNAAGTPRRRGGDPSRPSRGRRLVNAISAQQLPAGGTPVLDAAVARAVRRSDPSRPVISHSGRVPSLPLLDGTDTQMGVGWYVGGLRSLERWAAAVPRLVRFVSDFGAQTIAGDTETLAARSWPSIDWEAMAAVGGIEASQLIDRVPPAEHDSASRWATGTRRYQAEVLAHHIETLRRLKYRPAGGFCFTSLVAPTTGDPWAVIGADGTRREGFDAVVATCAPTVVVADRLPARTTTGAGLAVDIHVVNDRRSSIEGAEVVATLRGTSGEHRRRWSGSVDADAVARVTTFQFVTPSRPGRLTLDLELRGTDGTLSSRRYTTVVEDSP